MWGEAECLEEKCLDEECLNEECLDEECLWGECLNPPAIVGTWNADAPIAKRRRSSREVEEFMRAEVWRRGVEGWRR